MPKAERMAHALDTGGEPKTHRDAAGVRGPRSAPATLRASVNSQRRSAPNKKNVPVLASKREHTRLSKSALATATRLTMPRHKCSPNRVQAHTLRLFSPKHSITPLPPCQSELDSPRLPPASAARLLWTSSAAPRGREGVCPGREVARPRTANPV